MKHEARHAIKGKKVEHKQKKQKGNGFPTKSIWLKANYDIIL